MQHQEAAPKHKLGLWAYLSIAVSVVMLMCFSVFGARVAQHQIEAVLIEMRADTERIAFYLDAATTSDILAKRWDNLELILLNQVELGKLREIAVTDADGRILSRVLRDAGGRGRVSSLQVAPIPPQENTMSPLAKASVSAAVIRPRSSPA